MDTIEQLDTHYMDRAYQEALKALDEGEVPIGAIIVHNNRIIGRGYNRIEALQDATAHAEILAIGAAAASLGTWRLNECTLYVTVEPCMMCLGALLQSRVDRIVYGTHDPRLGAVLTHDYKETAQQAYGRFPAVTPNILQDRCAVLLKTFFAHLRKKD